MNNVGEEIKSFIDESITRLEYQNIHYCLFTTTEGYGIRLQESEYTTDYLFMRRFNTDITWDRFLLSFTEELESKIDAFKKYKMSSVTYGFVDGDMNILI
ncbi:hypothetical protein [Haloplasma contractile]|uniref:Uncharacterized protein n=1 Tax=Haloplasma contractile SSD-17B TaxID=1033810 RepID=U2FIL2_9MOLU|nr:hypothetical protein [Haloplasma contractile]ERJ11069.1 hypothetical protein HLPCO_002890 [Haloplasma contractile SSD-17B]